MPSLRATSRSGGPATVRIDLPAGRRSLYTIDGKPFRLPPEAAAQLPAIDADIATSRSQIAAQQAEVARYSGGLVQAMAMTTLGTQQQTLVMLEQRRAAIVSPWCKSGSAPEPPRNLATLRDRSWSMGVEADALYRTRTLVPGDKGQDGCRAVLGVRLRPTVIATRNHRACRRLGQAA